MATLSFTTPNADYTSYPAGAVHIEIGTIAAATSNVSNITLKVALPGGTVPTNLVPFKLWLSDSATGVGQTGTTASGTVTAKSSSGTVLDTLTAKKSLFIRSTGKALGSVQYAEIEIEKGGDLQGSLQKIDGDGPASGTY